jgi:hypothetical protein
LAFALRVKPDDVRPLIPGFDEKRYTSPTMMAAALNASGVVWDRSRTGKVLRLYADRPTLVRVQWTGPWTAEGANPKWAYRQTHWICAWIDDATRMVFDVNGGIRSLESWEREVVPPLIKACVPRADGGWFPTHCWGVWPRVKNPLTSCAAD